jgi:hypothetical protein
VAENRRMYARTDDEGNVDMSPFYGTDDKQLTFEECLVKNADGTFRLPITGDPTRFEVEAGYLGYKINQWKPNTAIGLNSVLKNQLQTLITDALESEDPAVSNPKLTLALYAWSTMSEAQRKSITGKEGIFGEDPTAASVVFGVLSTARFQPGMVGMGTEGEMEINFGDQSFSNMINVLKAPQNLKLLTKDVENITGVIANTYANGMKALQGNDNAGLLQILIPLAGHLLEAGVENLTN